jgi:hypothetical protein
MVVALDVAMALVRLEEHNCEVLASLSVGLLVAAVVAEDRAFLGCFRMQGCVLQLDCHFSNLLPELKSADHHPRVHVVP